MTSATNDRYGSAYERMSGGCTHLVAYQMLSNISPPINPSSYILDNACGPGIVTKQIKLLHPDAKIMGTDLSSSMLEEYNQQSKLEGWSNVGTEIQDVRKLDKIEDGTFTHVFTNLGLPVPGDAESGATAAAEMYQVLKNGGVAVISTWADRVWPTAFYKTALLVRPDEPASKLMEIRPDMMHAAWLASQMQHGGFGNNIEVKPCITYTSAASLGEMVENMMLAKQMFFGGYSDEELVHAKVLFTEQLQKLRTFEDFEGGVRIGMKAWIGVGRKRGDEGEVPV